MINLISDTATKPCKNMLNAMMNAEVGDDVFSADPTVNKLQELAANMFGMEAALYCPSGTMTNQIAIKTHTNPMDEMICEQLSHVYQSENAGYAYNSGIGVSLIQGKNGKITARQIRERIKPDYDWLPNSKLVVVENTCNIGGGGYYNTEELQEIADVCTENNLILHLDGARIFNALVETKQDPKEIGKLFDSISICISKGLGAPVGSLLIGKKDFIKRARKFRKSMGGGMRQAGYLAAACIYALENNIDRLSLDNKRAKQLGESLRKQSYVSMLRPVKTNIVIFDLIDAVPATLFLEKLNKQGILAVAFGPHTVRFVTHLDVSQEQVDKTCEILDSLNF